jgi:hypothetical protein
MIEQTLSFNPIPQALKPPIDLVRNKDFRGSPIVPEGLKDVDPSEQFTAYTPESMRKVGQLFDVSPIKLDYLLRGYLGSLGTYAVAAADAMVSPEAANGPTPSKRTSDQPVVRAFRREEPYRSTAYEQEFYDMLEESQRVVATAHHMRRTLRIPEEAGYRETNIGPIARGEPLKRVQLRLRDINDTMKVIRFTPDLSADDKRTQLDELQWQKNQLLQAATAGIRCPRQPPTLSGWVIAASAPKLRWWLTTTRVAFLPRGFGGCCAGLATTKWRCSMAGCRAGGVPSCRWSPKYRCSPRRHFRCGQGRLPSMSAMW